MTLKLKEFYQYKRELIKRNKVLESQICSKIRIPVLNDSKNLTLTDSSRIGQGIVYIKASQNNTIVTLTNLKGKVYSVKSCGCLGFQSKKKRSTKFAIEVTLLTVIQKAKESGWKKVGVYLDGFTKGRFYILNCLKKSQIACSIIRDITPIPHNGCRSKKLRRG